MQPQLIPMRLNPTFTVSHRLLHTPKEVIRHLRSRFVEHGVENFTHDEALEVSFLFEIEGRPARIAVEADQEKNSLHLITVFYGPTKRTETALNKLAAALNRGLSFAAAIVVNEEECTFALESWLVLDDGAALAGQIKHFADDHRETLSKLGPWIVRMLDGKINTTKVLSSLATDVPPDLENGAATEPQVN